MIIFAAPADRFESGIPIHDHRRISVANFEMDAAGAFVPRLRDELLEELAADPASPAVLRAMSMVTPRIGRIPAHCERVQASPKRSSKAASMIVTTSSR